MQIELPESKWVVEIKDNILYSEYEGIETFIANNLKINVEGANLAVQQLQKVEVDGGINNRLYKKIIETFLKSCRGDNNAEISILGLMDRLSALDGITLENAIMEKYEELKKKLPPIKRTSKEV